MYRVKNSLKTIFISILAISMTSCNHKTTLKRRIRADKPEIAYSAPEQPQITIWIHGTRPPHKWLKIARDSLYRAISWFINEKDLPYFHSLPGLHPAQEIPENFHLRMVADKLSAACPQQFPFEHFYVFGWSAKLDFKERYHEAHTLYEVLVKLVKEYQTKYKFIPTITIITHSHGGNVALNLAHAKNCFDDAINIDRLIMLACPIQEQTKQLSADDIFKNIYVFYSKGDLIQWIDPQGLYPVRDHMLEKKSFLDKKEWRNAYTKTKKSTLFSERCLPPHKKIKQVRIKIDSYNPLHLTFMQEKFITRLPLLLAETDTWFEKEKDHTAKRVLNIKTK